MFKIGKFKRGSVVKQIVTRKVKVRLQMEMEVTLEIPPASGEPYRITRIQ